MQQIGGYVHNLTVFSIGIIMDVRYEKDFASRQAKLFYQNKRGKK